MSVENRKPYSRLKQLTRRKRIQTLATGALLAALPAARRAIACDLLPLPSSEATAQALRYTDEASTAGPPHQ